MWSCIDNNYTDALAFDRLLWDQSKKILECVVYGAIEAIICGWAIYSDLSIDAWKREKPIWIFGSKTNGSTWEVNLQCIYGSYTGANAGGVYSKILSIFQQYQRVHHGSALLYILTDDCFHSIIIDRMPSLKIREDYD